MNILFCMRSTVYVRNFESTLRMLAEHGHQVHIVADRHWPESDELVRRLCAAYSSIRYSEPPIVPFNAWSFFGTELRAGKDYLRYLDPEFEHAPKLRVRAERNAPGFVLSILNRPGMHTRTGRRLLGRALDALDCAVPYHPEVEKFVRACAADLVLVTPLVEPGSPQSEYVRAARALGIPGGLCVYSWDNLTNKGLIHDRLDLMTVWNDAMKDEAVRLHKMPAERIEVTGAAPYDHWFKWRPRESRQELCARVGLPADRPYILYVCSSRFIAPQEVDFIRRWISELRLSSATLQQVGVLVRPHPQNFKQWKTAPLNDLPHVVVWPREGKNPLDDASRSDYYHSIYHSAAVVGVNTSALIESAIVGRAVYTVLAPEFRDTQEGTLHFHHLTHVNGGVLSVAHTMQEHVAQLESAVRGPNDEARCRRFVETFVRPYGIDVPATPRLVAAIEQAAARSKQRPYRGPWYGRLLRAPFARTAAHLARSDQARTEKAARRKAIKQRREAARVAQREEAIATRRQADARRAAEDAAPRIAYGHYLMVRDWLRPFRGSNASSGVSPVEQQMIAQLAHLWEATPNTIATLRQWCGPITGVQADDYLDSSPESELFTRLKRDVSFLRRQGGEALFVRESPLLGGFGFTRQHGLYNEDTIRYFKALTALHDGAVLDEFRGRTERRIVWEIGGGWGGFAFQFKTICRNVTYVITGIPQTLLVSAVYLMTAFPDARFRLHRGGTDSNSWTDWHETDFILVPESELPSLKPPRVDLVVDLMALRRMSERRVEQHVQRAFDVGARFFYSIEPGPIFPAEPPGAWRTIGTLYWPHPIPPRLDASVIAISADRAPQVDDYAHLIGWRRVRPTAVVAAPSLAAVE
jgi:hypothetical protein